MVIVMSLIDRTFNLQLISGTC